MDHLVAAMAMQETGADPTQVKYIPFDAGGKAMASLLSGEIKALSTGFSEAIGMATAGEVKIIGVTAPERVAAYMDAPTLKEQGYDVVFVNWRGFFGAPGLPEEKAEGFRAALARMHATPEWEEVRARNGWVNIYNPGDEFTAFLTDQEAVIKKLMQQLGFL
jgi:putative tricarboxylic transport membrane protein